NGSGPACSRHCIRMDMRSAKVVLPVVAQPLTAKAHRILTDTLRLATRITAPHGLIKTNFQKRRTLHRCRCQRACGSVARERPCAPIYQLAPAAETGKSARKPAAADTGGGIRT